MRPRDDWGPNARPMPPEAPNIPERPHPPPKLTIQCEETCIHLIPYSATSKHPHTVSPPTNIRQPNGTTHQRQLGSGMRPRTAMRPGALPHTQVNRQRISTSATRQARTRGREGTNRGREHDNGKRPGDGGSASHTHCPISTGRSHPSLKTTKYIE